MKLLRKFLEREKILKSENMLKINLMNGNKPNNKKKQKKVIN